MAFRADESARTGYEQVRDYLISRDIDPKERERSENALDDIVSELGPVVDRYPSWHPLVAHHDRRSPTTYPSERCGYEGLDHTRTFVNGFISCPYGDGQDIIDSVQKLPKHWKFSISAERLDVQFYRADTTPILVKCNWEDPLEEGQMIPRSIAIPLLLERELPCWHWASVGETWESMRPYFLGSPRGSRSSLFVSQETGQSMKKVWETLIYTGMFGPIKV